MDVLGGAVAVPAATEEAGQRVSIVHAALPGRVRLHLAGLHRAPALATTVERGMAALAGVQRVAASPRTGNVLVLYDPALSLARITTRLAHLADRRVTLPDSEPDWSAQDVATVAATLRSSTATGLDGEAARRRLAEVGRNTLPAPQPRAALAIAADQFATLPVLLLAGAGALSLLTGALLEAAAIAGVLLLNGGLGFTVESRSERRIAGLSRPPAGAARVLRNGTPQEVPFADVVPGDLLLLRPGTLVAADARLVRARDLSVNEAMLTGESLPVAKTADPVGPRRPLAERTSMLFRGTAVTGGTGMALAVATGARTEMGRIQHLLGSATRPPTPMERQLDELGRKLIGVSLLACASVFGIGLLRGFPLGPTLATAVSLAVAAIPEGLPTVATTALARGIEAMRREGALVRRLDALETLGAAQVVCFDKTGTLTRNRMTVTTLAADDARALLEIGALCSDVQLDIDGSPLGSSTEMALVAHAQGAGIDIAALRASHPRRGVQHRSEAGRFMATFHALPDDGGMLVAVKGSPDAVLDLCAVGATARAEAEQCNAEMARAGLRVLGFASARLPPGAPPRVAALDFLGLAGLSDPLRPEAPAQLAALRGAGVHCLVLTGDQPATARAVAVAAGLADANGPRVLDGMALEELDEAALAAAARRCDVFARVTPSQKLRVVQALQRAGVTVAMVGDGLNDGPALKAADVGIAMGRDGAEAAREVADIVLQDDGLASVVSGMRHGRAARDNVRRAARYLLGTNLSEIALVLAATAAGIAAPLAPLQLLWINLVSDVLPGIALTAEPPAPGLMHRPPPLRAAPVLDAAALGGLALDGGVIASGALAASLLGRGPAEARSVAFGSLTIAQLLHAFTCRPRAAGRAPNRALTGIIGASLAGQGAAMLVPGLRGLLGVTPIGPAAVAAMLAGGIGPYLVNEARLNEARARHAAAP